MTPIDASNNPDTVRYYISETASQIKSIKATPKIKVGDYVRNADKHNIFSKGTLQLENCVKLMKF